ncbi:hypothetical protein N7522_006345 [Penicillium canescens]|nr:hypothetical protein N7522_006345 [Penicillium canescens]
MDIVREKLQRLPETGNCTLSLAISWDPCGFIEEQKYDCSAEHAIENAITTTGPLHRAQALTVRQYLEQTWNASFSVTMEMIKAMVRNPKAKHQISCPRNPDNQLHGELKDGELKDGVLKGRQCSLRIMGDKEFIIHTAQQFAWLGAGFRSSTVNEGLVTCETIFTDVSIRERGEFSYILTYDLTEMEPSDWPPWPVIFRSVVVVGGYPVRPRAVSGLEIPLDMAMRLAQATEGLIKRNEMLFARGFTAGLMAEKVDDEDSEILVWRYCYREDGKRLSYLDFDDKSGLGKYPNKIPEIRDLLSYRHIIRSCFAAQDPADGRNPIIP